MVVLRALAFPSCVRGIHSSQVTMAHDRSTYDDVDCFPNSRDPNGSEIANSCDGKLE